MDLSSTSIRDGDPVEARYALAETADEGHVALSGNRNPHLAWSDFPESTRSFVVTCIDVDCPSAGDDVNQEDREVPQDLPRVDFVHWLLANIPANVTEIAEASHSDRVTPRGKTASAAPVGLHGLNDYTSWFGGDPDMGGEWHGYDGPAPPWNDSIVHRYEFTVHALDVADLDIPPGFTRDALNAAIQGHVLESASITVTYATNPRLGRTHASPE